MGARHNNALAPEKAADGQALLIVDMISCWDFLDAEKLLPGAVDIAPRIAAFKKRCRLAGVPTIYANDNLGRWRSDFRSLIDLSIQCRGDAAAVTTALRPAPDDYFVLKPKHSAFHATPLTLLLAHLKVRKVYMTGVSSDQCVMTSVAEARMRDLEVVVPRDLVASHNAERNDAAILQFEQTHGLRTTPASRIQLPRARPAGSRTQKRPR